MRIAVADIHGCNRTFQKGLQTIGFTKSDTLVICGDFIDRGKDTKGLLDFIINLIKEGYNIIPLIGNHEVFALEAAKNLECYKVWMNNGGIQTLQSYRFNRIENDWWKFQNAIPDEHWNFMDNLKTVHEMDDYVFVHAGLNFYTSNPITDSNEHDMLWERGIAGFNHKKIGGRTLITGHTPQTKDSILYMIDNSKLWGIDRGCCYLSSNYGHLCFVNLDTKECRFIRNCDDEWDNGKLYF